MDKNNSDTIRDVIRNAQIDYSVPFQNCAKVVGGTGEVAKCAQIYEAYNDLFQLININAMVNYCQNEHFTSDELNAFRLGFSALPAFLRKCAEEHAKNNEILRMQQESAKSLTSDENVA